VEVNMLEAFCLGEQRDIRLAAAQHLAQRRGEGAQQRAKLSGLTGGQLVQRGHVPARQHDQPSWQRCPERVRNPPPRAEVNPSSRRQVRQRVID